jgi:hypothetical protein
VGDKGVRERNGRGKVPTVRIHYETPLNIKLNITMKDRTVKRVQCWGGSSGREEGG